MYSIKSNDIMSGYVHKLGTCQPNNNMGNLPYHNIFTLHYTHQRLISLEMYKISLYYTTIQKSFNTALHPS